MLFPVTQEWIRLGSAAADVAVSQLWQGAAIALGLAISLHLAPRTRASHRFGLWSAAFVLVALLPLVSTLRERFATAHAQVMSTGSAPSAPTLQLDARWGLAVAALWGLLSLLRLALLAVGALRARRIWKHALPFPGASELFGERLAGRAPVQICLSRDLERPSVIGFFRPRILVPDWLAGKLSEGELRQIVLHEIEHLRRGDDWTNLALKLAVALLPLSPALWWIERELGREREMATDEAVVRRTRAPRAYAACLASVAERRLQMRLGQRELFELGIWRRRPELAERILSLLRTRETIGPLGRAALAGSLTAVLLVSGAFLACAPRLVSFVPPAAPAAMAAPQHLARAADVPAGLSLRPKAHAAEAAARTAVRATQPHVETAQAQGIRPAEGFVPVMARMEFSSRDEAMQEEGNWVVLAVFEQRGVPVRPDHLSTDFSLPDPADGAEKSSAGPTPQPAQQVPGLWRLLPVVPVRAGVLVLEL